MGPIPERSCSIAGMMRGPNVGAEAAVTQIAGMESLVWFALLAAWIGGGDRSDRASRQTSSRLRMGLRGRGGSTARAPYHGRRVLVGDRRPSSETAETGIGTRGQGRCCCRAATCLGQPPRGVAVEVERRAAQDQARCLADRARRDREGAGNEYPRVDRGRSPMRQARCGSSTGRTVRAVRPGMRAARAKRHEDHARLQRAGPKGSPV